MKPETRDYLEGKTLKVDAFIKGSGKTKHMQLRSCVQEPRLTQTWVKDSKGNSTTTWAVDGERVADLDEAVAKLREETTDVG